jgi:PAS domain S-box-containing protein
MQPKLILHDLVKHFPTLGSRGYRLDRTPSGRHNLRQVPAPAFRAGRLEAPETAAERAISELFGHPEAMVFVVDTVEGRFLQVNQKVTEVFGFSEKELIETSFLERVHPDDLRRTLLEIGRLTARQRSEGFRNRHRTADGSYVTLEWTAVFDPDSDLCYAMALVVDG